MRHTVTSCDHRPWWCHRGRCSVLDVRSSWEQTPSSFQHTRYTHRHSAALWSPSTPTTQHSSLFTHNSQGYCRYYTAQDGYNDWPLDSHCCHMGTAIICNFWHPGTLTLRAERQSARMSKITNDGLTRLARGSSGHQRFKTLSLSTLDLVPAV